MGNKALRIARSIAGGSQNALKGGENLLPVFDALGNVVAYERSMDPAQLNGLQQDTHLGRMLGTWTGRIAEESMAEEFNRDLLKVIKKTYDEQSKDTAKYPGVKWINVADKKNTDPLVRDAWNALGWKIKANAAAIFGPDYLPVRADLVNDTIGYQVPGIAVRGGAPTRRPAAGR